MAIRYSYDIRIRKLKSYRSAIFAATAQWPSTRAGWSRSIVKVLTEEKLEAVFYILNRLFAAIDYVRYPIKDEFLLRAFVQVYSLEPV